jgi:trans-aconitate methyltransferase
MLGLQFLLAPIPRSHFVTFSALIFTNAILKYMKMNETKRFLQRLLRELAEKDLLNPDIPVELVVEQRFNWETESQHQQLINKVKEWRSKGKVNWKDEII